MYRIGIIERDVETGTRLEQWFLKYGAKMQMKFEICRWMFEEELMADIANERTPDILFLPIGEKVQLSDPEQAAKKSWWNKLDGRTREAQLKAFHNKKKDESPWTGVSLGMKLREKFDACRLQLIYYAQKNVVYEGMIQTQPLELLIEPLSEKAVLSALRRALEIVKEKNERFVFQKGKDFFFLPTRDVQYICGDGRNVIVKTSIGEYQFIAKLKDIAGHLPEDYLVIHRSYIINKNYVLRYNYEYLEMMDGTLFSISKPNRVMMRKILLDH